MSSDTSVTYLPDRSPRHRRHHRACHRRHHRQRSGVQERAAVRRMDRPHPQPTFHWWQGPLGPHQQAWRCLPPRAFSARCPIGIACRIGSPRSNLALGTQSAGATRLLPRNGGYCQQECAHRLGLARQERDVALSLNSTPTTTATVDDESVRPTPGHSELFNGSHTMPTNVRGPGGGFHQGQSIQCSQTGRL